jgi:hypothetical protein
MFILTPIDESNIFLKFVKLLSNLLSVLKKFVANIKNREYHAILKKRDGSYQNANFLGPGSDLKKRFLLEPVSEADKISKAHDFRYALLDRTKSYNEQLEYIRNSDEKFIRKLEEVRKNKKDSEFNLKQADFIKLKIIIEDVFPNFRNFMYKITVRNHDRQKYDKTHEERFIQALFELELEGY